MQNLLTKLHSQDNTWTVETYLKCAWNNETDTIFYYTGEHSAATITNRVHVLDNKKSRCAILEPYAIFEPSPLEMNNFSKILDSISYQESKIHSTAMILTIIKVITDQK